MRPSVTLATALFLALPMIQASSAAETAPSAMSKDSMSKDHMGKNHMTSGHAMTSGAMAKSGDKMKPAGSMMKSDGK